MLAGMAEGMTTYRMSDGKGERIEAIAVAVVSDVGRDDYIHEAGGAVVIVVD